MYVSSTSAEGRDSGITLQGKMHFIPPCRKLNKLMGVRNSMVFAEPKTIYDYKYEANQRSAQIVTDM